MTESEESKARIRAMTAEITRLDPEVLLAATWSGGDVQVRFEGPLVSLYFLHAMIGRALNRHQDLIEKQAMESIKAGSN